jgi:hypothetical protein
MRKKKYEEAKRLKWGASKKKSLVINGRIMYNILLGLCKITYYDINKEFVRYKND